MSNVFAVLVIDMFHYAESEHETIIRGFPTRELAIEYARRRTRDSLEEHRKSGQSKEELSDLWHTFGEDVLALDEPAYRGSSELDFFIEHPAMEMERDWLAIEKELGARLTKSAAE